MDNQGNQLASQEKASLSNIAVLIDADNAQPSKMKTVLDEISAHGRIALKRAYGNWRKDNLKVWSEQILDLAISEQQQTDYTKHKNASDIKLVIDAMDLLYMGIYDGYAIISSDSDFTALAIKLKESGAFVLGAGNAQTPKPFVRACDEFIITDYLDAPLDEEEAAQGRTAGRGQEPQAPRMPDFSEMHPVIAQACNTYGDERGYAGLSAVCSYVKRMNPDFSPKNYGSSNFSKLLSKYPSIYELKQLKNETTMYVRCIGER